MPEKGNKKQLWGFIGLSIGAHVLVLGVMSHGLIFPSAPNTPEESATSIQAKLIFIPPPVETEVVAEEATETAVEAEQSEPLIEEPAIADIPPPQESDPILEQAPPSEPVEVAEAPIVETPQTSQQVLTGTSTEKDYRLSSRELAQQHLGNYQQKLTDELAVQSAREFRTQQTSPNLNLPAPLPFKSEEEKFRENVTVKVDCSSTVNKSMATLSKFVGGVLDCSKGPSLAPFIQNRVNKLPAGYKPNDKPEALQTPGNP